MARGQALIRRRWSDRVNSPALRARRCFFVLFYLFCLFAGELSGPPFSPGGINSYC